MKTVAKQIFEELERNAMSSAVESYVEHGIWIRESVYQQIKKKYCQ